MLVLLEMTHYLWANKVLGLETSKTQSHTHSHKEYRIYVVQQNAYVHRAEIKFSLKQSNYIQMEEERNSLSTHISFSLSLSLSLISDTNEVPPSSLFIHNAETWEHLGWQPCLPVAGRLAASILDFLKLPLQLLPTPW